MPWGLNQTVRSPAFDPPRMSEVRLSPTIMASAGARCNHVNHVATQLPYALVTAVCTAALYIAFGLIL